MVKGLIVLPFTALDLKHNKMLYILNGTIPHVKFLFYTGKLDEFMTN